MTKIKHYPITKLFKEIAVPQEQHEKKFTTNISCSSYITTLLFSHIFSNPNMLIQSKKIQIREFSRFTELLQTCTLPLCENMHMTHLILISWPTSLPTLTSEQARTQFVLDEHAYQKIGCKCSHMADKACKTNKHKSISITIVLEILYNYGY